MTHLVRFLEREIEIIRSAGEIICAALEQHDLEQHHKETFTMSVVTTDDNDVRLKPRGIDKDGVTAAATATGFTATIDQPSLASIEADPNNPGEFLVKRLPTTDPSAGSLTVTATLTDPATGISASLPIEFDAGKVSSLVIDADLVPSAAASAPATTALPAVGDTVSLPVNPSDPGGPAADHTVTAVAPDGSTVTAQPVAGGDPVTVAAADITPAAS